MRVLQRKSVTAMFAAAAVTFGAGAYVAASGNEGSTHDHASHDHHDHDHSTHDHSGVADGRNDPFGILGEDTGEALPDRDPCTVVPLTVAEVALGSIVRVTESGVGVIGGQRVCTYSLAENPALGASVAITDTDASDKFAILERYHAADLSRVEDLDDAIWVPSFRLLVVVKGDWLLSVQVLVPGEEPALSRAKAIDMATAALERL